VKFTDRGTIDVIAELDSDDCAARHLSITVRDTGNGMSRELLDQINSGFTQGEDVYIKTSRGMGIGLPFCRSLVELMNGRLTIESTTGVGTTIQVCIPA